MKQVIDWIKKNPVLAAALTLAIAWILLRRCHIVPAQETFSTCYERKQIYLNSVDPDEPTGVADVNIEKRWGKMHITVNANLPYVHGGVLHSMYGAYHVLLVDPASKQSINLGTLARHGDRWYKLATELAGNYGEYDIVQVWRQTEDYAPKLILQGSISGQQCTSL